MKRVSRQAIPPDYDTDPQRFRAGQEAVRRYSTVGDVHEPVAGRICAEKLSPVLDVGCGEGRLVVPLRIRGVQVVGLDSSPTMLVSIAEPKVLADAKAIPFCNSYFAAVAALYMLYHLFEPREVLAESRRVLRTNGMFVACAPSRNDNPELAGMLPESPPDTFDAENGPDLVREFFQDIEVQRWDAPLIHLPNEHALLMWLKGYGLSDKESRDIAGQVSLPLTLTKRGALIFAYKRV
jgi:SAM-dependent methyltransferase